MVSHKNYDIKSSGYCLVVVPQFEPPGSPVDLVLQWKGQQSKAAMIDTNKSQGTQVQPLPDA